MNAVPLETAVAQLYDKLDALEANPKLHAQERHKEYYGHSSVHEGSLLKEEALVLCASVDSDSPEYRSLIMPLIKRIEAFFSHPNVELDFADEVRMLRAKRLIEQDKYHAAHQVYRHIAYGPLYAQAFAQRNCYFLAAAKNHLHLFKKMSDAFHARHQLLAAMVALAYVQEYPHGDDITLYQNAHAIFAQNYYQEAKMQVLKICHDELPRHLDNMNQHELLTVYQALLPYKYALSHDIPDLSSAQHFHNRLERWSAVSQWYVLVKTLQQHFIAKLFNEQQFNRPDETVLANAHALLDEPTSKIEQLKHWMGKTDLDKNFSSALMGNTVAMQNLQRWVR